MSPDVTNPTVAIVGATGAVGRTMLAIVEQREFPLGDLRLMASARSAGTELDTPVGPRRIEDLEAADPSGIDIALFSAGGDRSRAYAPRFAEAGAVVIDNSSAFRMDPEVPLVVADVNDHAIPTGAGIIANPNCTTMTLMMAAGPLHREVGIRTIVASSYQATGGSGRAGIDELMSQIPILGADPEPLIDGSWKDPGSEVYPRPIAFNVIPLAGTIAAEEHTDEEWKMVNETRKILAAPEILVEPFCARVPVAVGHGISATIRFSRPVEVDEARELIAAAPSVEVWDDKVPTPLDAAGRDETLVGRIRPTLGEPGGISLWVVGDNLRKGAALNTIQIAERWLARS
ncbi:MAG: aspartate-semialdehyde dehydrogenase [Acidimicrobiia bacterium]|nr:aspartate-semialdehyde dehydrogenase [Acidimicrobiia bacterium]